MFPLSNTNCTQIANPPRSHFQALKKRSGCPVGQSNSQSKANFTPKGTQLHPDRIFQGPKIRSGCLNWPRAFANRRSISSQRAPKSTQIVFSGPEITIWVRELGPNAIGSQFLVKATESSPRSYFQGPKMRSGCPKKPQSAFCVPEAGPSSPQSDAPSNGHPKPP